MKVLIWFAKLQGGTYYKLAVNSSSPGSRAVAQGDLYVTNSATEFVF